MDTLIFYVKGSAKEPYRIIAEGAGASLRIFCSCPAGRKGGSFCKHAAYLLQGDVTKLVSPSTDDVTQLRERAEGSELLNKAGVRVAADIKQSEYGDISSIDEVLRKYRDKLESLGWTIKVEHRDGEREEHRLELWGRFKNGNLRRGPSLWLEYVPYEPEYDYDHESPSRIVTFEVTSIRKRERPWGIRTTGGKSIGRTWKSIDGALPDFFKLAEG